VVLTSPKRRGWHYYAVTHLPPPEEKARVVRDMFDRLAPRYDRLNRIMTGRMDQRWRQDVVRRLRITDADTVIDLASGTGDFSELARQQTRHVIGVDFARAMLLQAQARGLHGVDFVQGDALNLPLAGGCATVAVSGFALRNFASLPPVFAELARVIRRGGRIGLLEVDQPGNPVLRAGHSFYFNRVVPIIGGLFAGDRDAYHYLPESAAYLPPEADLLGMIEAAGFERVRKRRHMGGAVQSILAVRS
jgi:demethylmenaquinone methyltransferase/2-methoxy-6-polyprenyl-1,4-benzoquinol methylase